MIWNHFYPTTHSPHWNPVINHLHARASGNSPFAHKSGQVHRGYPAVYLSCFPGMMDSLLLVVLVVLFKTCMWWPSSSPRYEKHLLRKWKNLWKKHMHQRSLEKPKHLERWGKSIWRGKCINKTGQYKGRHNVCWLLNKWLYGAFVYTPWWVPEVQLVLQIPYTVRKSSMDYYIDF